MGKDIYPLKFEPMHRQRSWGGTLLAECFGRDLETNALIGEALELIDDGETQSIVANGPLSGDSLRSVVERFPKALVSNRHRPANPLPLCVKYLATGRQLPVMVHPDDLATGALEATPPNTKMWFVIAAQPRAEVIAGIKPRYTQQQFLSHLHSPDLEGIVQSFPAEPGDAYYLSAGRIHSLSAGNLVLSIEQNATPPLAVSNWGREDEEVALDSESVRAALQAIHFQDRTISRIRGDGSTAQRNRKLPLVNHCPHFTVDELRLVRSLHERTDGSSFHWLSAVDGAIDVTANQVTVSLARGEGCLIPASSGYYELAPQGGLTKVVKVAMRT